MRELLRPDAIEILKDRKAVESLKNYFGIVAGKRERKAEVCKRIECNFDANSGEEELWKLHDEKIKEYREVEEKAAGSEKVKLKKPESSLLDLKIELADRVFRRCEFCERNCSIDRYKGETGFCGVVEPRISSMFHHYGEEPELVPSYTIFFSGCNFSCRFCQNYDISQSVAGESIDAKLLGKELDEIKARNVNWVGGEPTPNLNYILKVLKHSKKLPSVWNSNMYMSKKAMALLEGTQDVYLADFKYGNDECALKLSRVHNYVDLVLRNHKIAGKQAELIIRHLVLPNHIDCCTRNVVKLVSENLGKEVRFNLMFQYRPVYKAYMCEEINRSLTGEEKERALEIVKDFNLENFIT